MAAYPATETPPPYAPANAPTQVNVNLTDTVPWGWYLVAVLLPIVGFIAGIVFMAKSKIGPAIALWATCFIAALTWGGIYAAVEYNRVADDFNTVIEESSTTDSGSSAYSECVDQAQTVEEIADC